MDVKRVPRRGREGCLAGRRREPPLAARGESPAAFAGRCIPPGCIEDGPKGAAKGLAGLAAGPVGTAKDVYDVTSGGGESSGGFFTEFSKILVDADED